MAPTEKEIQKELKIALKEVGEIKPRYDKEVAAWVFEHDAYPVSYAGDTLLEVVKNYPLYLKEFIFHRMQGRVEPRIEKKTKGRGGLRVGAGRPRGSVKEQTKRVSLPLDIADCIKDPNMLAVVRYLKENPATMLSLNKKVQHTHKNSH